MSRSNYSDNCDGWDLIRWRGAVTSAIKGKRGQAALKELLAALDAMPEKALIAHALEADGQYCTLGVLGKARQLPLAEVDPDEPEKVAELFDLSDAFVREVANMNDEGYFYGVETPKHRWQRMRDWVAGRIAP